MNTSTLLISISILIIAYPFSVYFKLKNLDKSLSYHWENIEALLEQYKANSTEETLKKLDHERRVYNSLVRANDHKLNSSIGQFIAKRYGFEKKEHFNFKG